MAKTTIKTKTKPVVKLIVGGKRRFGRLIANGYGEIKLGEKS